MTSLGTVFYRLLVVSALAALLINGVPKNASRDLTLISGVSTGLSHQTAAVSRTMPEPAILLLMGGCLAGIGAKMRRRVKKA